MIRYHESDLFMFVTQAIINNVENLVNIALLHILFSKTMHMSRSMHAMTNKLFGSFCLRLAIFIVVGHHAETFRFGECSEVVRNPGLVVLLTEDELTIVTQAVYKKLFEILYKYRIAFDFSGKSSSLIWSTIRYKLSAFTLTEYEQQKTRVSITKAKGLVLNMSLPILKFKGKYSLELHNGPWLQYSRKGSILATISGTTLEFSLEYTIHEDGNRVNRTLAQCSARIKGIDVDLQDPDLNSLIAGVNWDVEAEKYQEKFCRAIKLLVEGEHSFSYKFTKDIYLDLSILNNYVMHDGYIEVQYVGEVRYIGDERHYSRLPEPLVTDKPTGLSAYKLSDFVFNSFGYVVHNHNLLSFIYSKSDLPELRKHLLDTTCESECFGKLFPNVSTRWPYASVEMGVTTAEAPFVQITPESFKVIFEFDIEVCARLANDSAPLLFSIHLSLSADVASSVRKNRICFHMRNPNSSITTIESRIGDLPEDKLVIIVNQAFQKVLPTLMKQFAINGFDLKYSNLVPINEYELKLMNDELSLIILSVNENDRDPTSKHFILRVIVNLFLFSALR